MNLNLFLPIFIGAIGILQAALNRNMSSSMGLVWACIIGNVVTLLVCVAFYFIVKLFPDAFPAFVKLRNFEFKLWHLLPGIFGFLFLTGLPYSIDKIGAVKSTVGLIAAQMVTSVLWDFFVENIQVNLAKGFGIFFALLSVILISFF